MFLQMLVCRDPVQCMNHTSSTFGGQDREGEREVRMEGQRQGEEG